MNISSEKVGELTNLLKIEIEEKDYRGEVDKMLKEQRRKTNVPGFRVGMVPMSMIKKMYGNAITADRVEKVMSESLYKYFDDNKIDILGSPMANDEKTPKIDWDRDTTFTFYFDYAVEPKFDLDLKDVKTTLYEIEPSEDNINKFVEDTSMRFGKVETPETIGEKDMIYGHLEELNDDGTKKEDGIDTNSTMYVERIALVTIKKQFLNKKKDSVIVFKPSKALKDSAMLATFLHKAQSEVNDFASDCRFTVMSIQRMTPAERNEDFYSKVYPGKDIKSEEDFIKAVKEDLTNTYTKESERYFFNKVSEQLVKETALSLPEDFLKRWLLSTDKNIKEKELDDNFAKYMDGFRWEIIEKKIAEQHNIKVENEDVLSYYKNDILPQYFPAMPDETEEQKKEREQSIENTAMRLLGDRNQSRSVVNYLLDNKITKVLEQETKISHKKISMDDFIKEITPDKSIDKKSAKKKSTTKETKSEDKE